MANQVHTHQDIDSCLKKTNLIVLLITSKWLVYENNDPSVYWKGYSIMTVLEWKQVQKLPNSGVKKNSSDPQRRRVVNIQDEVFLLTFPAEENWHESQMCPFDHRGEGQKLPWLASLGF